MICLVLFLTYPFLSHNPMHHHALSCLLMESNGKNNATTVDFMMSLLFSSGEKKTAYFDTTCIMKHGTIYGNYSQILVSFVNST